jgi:hypothetical protein
MVMNSINPVSDYEYINLSNNIYKLIFRTDIQNKNTHYNYNEYTIITSINSDDIDTEISSNFDTYLKMAKLQDEEIQRRNQIDLQKKQLSNSDYQVIKCAENYMLGSVLPYDFSQLLATRTEMRNKINELESGVKFISKLNDTYRIDLIKEPINNIYHIGFSKYENEINDIENYEKKTNDDNSIDVFSRIIWILKDLDMKVEYPIG